MAELLLGPLLSAVKDKASSYLLDKYKVMEGMEEQHKILKRKLPAILDIVTDAEEQAAHREGAKAWLQELKMVAYDANQVFDEFKYEALRRQAKKDGHYTKLGFDVIKLFPTHNRIAFRYRMGHKLREIVRVIEVLVAEMNAFGFKYQRQAPAFKQWRQTDSIIVDPENIASRSRDAEKHKIIKILTDATANLTVLPLVGMGGLGKTTLAQLIYNDPQVERHFQHQRWVCVSDVFDVYALARKICPSQGDNEDALNKLQAELTGKRYLIVLDDVWNRDDDKWDKLKACLQHGATGSVILVTTRFKEIAQLMGTTQEHDVAVLDKEFIHEIIKTRAFGKPGQEVQRSEPAASELLSMVDKFVNKCNGSPLAAKALGSVLRTKTSVEQWNAVLDESITCTNESGILPILKLSYDDLPSHMKQCFAFCAVFPKDYEIDVEKLIQLWVANGFIQAQKEVSPESIGTHVFNDLASRSFFQVKKLDLDPKDYYREYSRTTCTIHDLMHDVALSIMEKECVVKTDQEPSQTEWLPDTARHVFLSCEEPGRVLNDAMKKGSSPAIQTLLCDCTIEESLYHLSKYNSMQALQLQQYNQSTFLMKAKHLRHLRYLDLSQSDITLLPGDISILYNLQTLNLSGCGYLRRLPRQMKYMTSLRHLYTHGCRKLRSMPPDLRKLTSLQTLSCFVAAGSGSDDHSNVSEIQNLDLGGHLELSQLENVTKADAKLANLVNKKRLKVVTFKWTSGREEEDQRGGQCDLEVLEGLTPHDGLQVLSIYSYGGTTFPKCIGMLRNMVTLFLVGCKRCEILPLCSLPALEVLYLEGLLKLRWLCSPDASFDLPNLKKLSLEELPDLERWWEIEERQEEHVIMFPHLEQLYIIECPKLRALPGQQNFPNLESVCIEYSREFIIIPAEAPKLSVLEIEGGNHDMSLCVARCMTSLTVVKLYLDNIVSCETTTTATASPSLIQLVDGDQEKWNQKSSLVKLELSRCNMFFICSNGALAGLWTCFVQLRELGIWKCDVLVHWPEKEFGSLVSLVTLKVVCCKNLTGYARREASTISGSRSQLILPCLESLEIFNCGELVEVLDVSACIKKLEISFCRKMESIFRKQPVQGMSALIKEGSYSETTGAVLETELRPTDDVPCLDYVTSVPRVEPSTARQHHIFPPPFLQELALKMCGSLSGVLNVSPSLKKMTIWNCNNLQSISCCQYLDDELQTQTVQEDHLAAASTASSTTSVPTTELSSSSVVAEAAPREEHYYFPSPPCLESVDIGRCDSLTEIPSMPKSIKRIAIYSCDLLKSVESLSAGLPLLEDLRIVDCETLASLLPDHDHDQQQSYSQSLQGLTIRDCPGLKTLPRCLQQRLSSLERKNIDARYEDEEPEPESATWKYALNKCLCRNP